MGSAAEAPIAISSDDEDGAQAPAAGKRKSPEDDALAWAEGLLDQDDCDDEVVSDGVGFPAIMKELLDSLKDETRTVVGDKEGVVGDKNTSTVPDARGGGGDDDDDDCVILDGDPDKPVAVAKEDGAPAQDAAEDELQIVAEKGELACRDFPHPRHLCAVLPFSTSSHASHCSMCHCYVCDCPAPCALWITHCNATDQDARWKKLRQISKTKSQPDPKRRIPQHLNRSITAGPSSQYGRFPASGASTMVAQNMGQGTSQPSAPSPMPRTEMPSYGSKGAQFAPPIYASSNGNHLQHYVPSYGLVQPTRPHVSQTEQVSPGGHGSAGTFQRYHPQFPVGAPMGSQGHQYRPPSYPQLAPHTIVGTGVPLSRCASLNSQAQGTQRPQVPSADTISKESLANLARRLGLSDHSTNQPLGQQSMGTSQNTTWHAHAKKSYVATTSQIVPSSGHKSSNHAPGGTVLSSGSVQIQKPLCQLKSGTVFSFGSAQIQQPLCQLKFQSTVTPSETASNTLHLPQP